MGEVSTDDMGLGEDEVMLRRFVCPDLVGREHLLSQLEDSVLEARRGRGLVAMVGGEAGMGKTRLVSEAASVAEKLGVSVLWGGCPEGATPLPFQPFVEALGNFLTTSRIEEVGMALGPVRQELSQLFPQLAASREGAATDPLGRVRLFEAIVELIKVGADPAVMLVIEDIHWADDSTRDLLDHLTRRVANLPVLVLATYRSDEIDRKHPLRPLLQGWRRSGGSLDVTLDPLSQDDIAEMAALILGAEGIDSVLADVLHERTEGSPFVLEEVIKSAVEAGGSDPSAWTRKILDEIKIPDPVKNTILTRVDKLDDEVREVLRAASVIGESFDPSVLEALSRREPREVADAVQAAHGAQLLVPGGGDRYRWRHALTREAIYEDIVLPIRREMHSRAADLLAEKDAPPTDLVHHLLGAGRFSEVPPLARRCAEAAEATLANADAGRFWQLMYENTESEPEKTRALCLMGRNRWKQTRLSEAIEILVHGIEALESFGLKAEAGSYRVVLGRCYWEAGRADDAMAELQKARTTLDAEGPSEELALCLIRIGGLHVFRLEHEQAAATLEQGVSIAEQAGAEEMRLWALVFLATNRISQHMQAENRDGVLEGYSQLKETMQASREAGFNFVRWNAVHNGIWHGVHAYLHHEEMWSWMPDIDREAGDLPNSPGGTIARLRVAEGRLGWVTKMVEEARRLTDNPKFLYRLAIWQTQELIEMGNVKEALKVAPSISDRKDMQDILYDTEALIALYLATGDTDRALEVVASVEKHLDHFRGYARVMAPSIEALVAAGELKRAERLMSSARVIEGFGDVRMHMEKGRVLLAQGDPGAAAEVLKQSVDGLDTLGYRLEAASARVLYAQALARSSDPEGAARTLGEVVAEAQDMGARRILEEAFSVAADEGIDLAVSTTEAPQSQPDPRVSRGERMITSLFADIRGYTDMTESTAAREMSDRIGTLYRLAKGEVESRGGIVDKFAGDAVMATFNVHRASVDHTQLALEAAMSLLEKAQMLGLPMGAGIAVGPAVIGRAVEGHLMVNGSVVNLAARLQASAQDREILLSGEAFKRVKAWLEERELEASAETLELKGFADPQEAHRVRAH